MDDALRLQSPDCLSNSLSLHGRRSVQMANGDRQSVGGIGWFGNLDQVQQARHHVLNLRLLRAAVSNDRRLNRERCILSYVKAGRRSCQHGNAAHLSEFERRFRIDCVENFFNGYLVGLVSKNQLRQLLVDSRKTCG